MRPSALRFRVATEHQRSLTICLILFCMFGILFMVDGTTSKFSTLAFVCSPRPLCLLMRSVLIDRPLIYGSSSYKLTKLESKVLRKEKDLSSRQCSFHADRWTSIVLIHYLCEPNYIIGEFRVQTELASQVLFFLSEKRGRRDERGRKRRN